MFHAVLPDEISRDILRFSETEIIPEPEPEIPFLLLAFQGDEMALGRFPLLAFGSEQFRLRFKLRLLRRRFLLVEPVEDVAVVLLQEILVARGAGDLCLLTTAAGKDDGERRQQEDIQGVSHQR